jgi:spore photoproduct lyase
MLKKLAKELSEFAKEDFLTFEMIQHRFTKPAKRVIQQNYSMTKFKMDESKRKWKWGCYGIGKYVYTDPEQEEMKDTLGGFINAYFPEAKIEYFT